MLEPLETRRLIIRKWEERDREAFYRLNSDEKIMRFFPFRRSREEADRVMDNINRLIKQNGFCFSALEFKETGNCIGLAGLHRLNIPTVFSNNEVEIGWRLIPEYWGKGLATEAGFRLLEFAFNQLNLNEIISFAVPENKPSTAVMRRIGMHHDPSRDFEHPQVPDTHPELKYHVCYSIVKTAWLKQKAAAK